MDAKQYLKINVGITAVLTIVLGIVVITSNGGNVYFTWGPDENLHFVSFTIDNWGKYIGVLVGIIPLAWMDVYTYDKIYPYFFTRIYMDDAPIKDWTRDEKWALAFWAELSYGTTNFRFILDTLLTVTNFYFAIWRWLLKEIVCIYIINDNLNKKFSAQSSGAATSSERLLSLKQKRPGITF